MTIPNHLIFVWIGKHIPWSFRIAMKSAIQHCTPERVFLFQQRLEQDRDQLSQEVQFPDLEIVEVNSEWIQEALQGIEQETGSPTVVPLISNLIDTLPLPSSKSNLIRMAALWKYGGIYLDGDTVTIQDLADLRTHTAFCGLEHVVLSQSFYQSKNPLKWAWAGLRMGWRDLCTRFPNGYKWFRKTKGLYPLCANNAVMGFQAHHPLLKRAFLKISNMTSEEQYKRFRLGTHLMQKLTNNVSQQNISMLGESYFYPLGPELSNHWFQFSNANWEKEFLSPNTKVVHWYHSVETRLVEGKWNKKLNEDFIKQNPTLPYSQLIQPYL